MSDHIPFFPENLDDYAPWVAKHGLVAPYGECQCGCGERTAVSARSDSRYGKQSGEPSRFIRGHTSATVCSRIETHPSKSDSESALIALTRGYVVKVDADNYEVLSQFRWYAKAKDRRVYAARTQRINGVSKTIMMHREIIEVPDGMFVDHIDRNTLNNRRDNLRLATKSQNNWNTPARRGSNTSQFKGVHFDSHANKWIARIKAERRTVHIGLFVSEEEAARAYDNAAKQYHGEFAYLNFWGNSDE